MNPKHIFLLLLSVFLLGACDSMYDKPVPPRGDCDPSVVSVRFHNTLDIDILDAKFVDNDTTTIGPIPAHGYSGYVTLSGARTGDGMMMGVLSGVGADNSDIMAWAGLWCGTGVVYESVIPGCYTLKISTWDFDWSDSYQFSWE